MLLGYSQLKMSLDLGSVREVMDAITSQESGGSLEQTPLVKRFYRRLNSKRTRVQLKTCYDRASQNLRCPQRKLSTRAGIPYGSRLKKVSGV